MAILKVPKSLIANTGIDDLAKAVADHKAEHASWSAHMARVAADAKLPPIPRPLFADYAKEKNPVAAFRQAMDVYEANVATRHQPYKPPEPHQLVAFVLANGGTFEVLNDDPTPEQILAEKKLVLIHQISSAEAAAVQSVMPPIGKQRAYNLREADIGAADVARANKLIADGETDPVKLQKAVEKGRPADDTAHLRAQADRRTKVDAIIRAASQMMSDVEDLTIENIDAWRMTPLPGAA